MSSGPPDFKAMNQTMVARLLDAPASPIPEGGYGLRVLEVVGRRTGQPARTPMGVLVYDGRQFVVCPDQTRDWPQNLRAAGHAVLRAQDLVEPVDAHEISGTAAAEVVAAYVGAVTVPWALAAFRLAPGATAEDALPELGRMAVFELSPAPVTA